MRVTIAEAAQRLRLSEQTVRRRLRSGELEGVQMDSPGGFTWMVELPEGTPNDEPFDKLRAGSSDGEIKVLRELVDTLKSQVDSQTRQIEQLHVLLQQAQAALPPPRNGRPWWKWWR